MIRDELIPLSYDPDQTIHLPDLRLRLRRGRTYVILTSKGTCIGFIHLIPIQTTLWIDMLAVDRRFQNRGLGRQLLALADKYALSKALTRISLFVDAHNAGAIRFYERAHFQLGRYIAETRCYQMDKSMTDTT